MPPIRRHFVYTYRDVAQLGTFATAAGGGLREQKGVAAVEILRSEQRAINFGHRNRKCSGQLRL